MKKLPASTCRRTVDRVVLSCARALLTLGLSAGCSEHDRSAPNPTGTEAGAPAAGSGGIAGSRVTAGRAATSIESIAGAAGGEPGAGSGGPNAITGGAGAAGMPASAAGEGGEPKPVVSGTGGANGANGGACTRELLQTTADAYFGALAAREPELLPLDPAVKFTENGDVLELGDGLWATAGPVKFEETLLDTQSCSTLTQAVVPDGNTDIPYAVRLKLVAQKITEIETIAVRSGDYLVASNTPNLLALASDPWQTLVPEAERQTRAELEGWIDKYFRMFPMGGCNLASDCRRMENGFSLACSAGATCSDAAPSGNGVMIPRLILADVEAGLAAGFVMFQGRYTDVHLIKYFGGRVRGVHTILGEADGSGWD